MIEQSYFTKEGLEKTKKQAEELKTIKRRAIAERIQSAKDLGDLSENAEYSAAKNEQSLNESKILELENSLRNAVVIKAKDKSGIINIGSQVKIKMNGNEQEYFIVGDNDIDPFKGKISHRSPLGHNLIGKKVGDIGEITAPKGLIKFKIITVS